MRFKCKKAHILKRGAMRIDSSQRRAANIAQGVLRLVEINQKD